MDKLGPLTFLCTEKQRACKYFMINLCCLFMGSISECGERESGILAGKRMADHFMFGELSWGQSFGWSYHAYAEEAAKEPEEIMQACMEGEAEWKVEGCFAVNRRMQRQDEVSEEEREGKVEVMRASMSQEALFTHINALSEELFLYNIHVSCVIAGDAAITQFVRVDAGEEHWLYLQQGETVYALYSFMAEESWQTFLEGWLLAAELKWSGESVCGNRSELPAGYCEEGFCKYFLYDEFIIHFEGSRRVLSCQHDEAGFSLKLERDKKKEGDGKETEVCEFWIQTGVDLPDCGSEADYLSYFVESYPTMSYYRVDLKDWEYGEEAPLQVFYVQKCASPYALESYFEDINADGYQDLIVVNTFAAANLNAAVFLWSPSEGRFLEDTGVLDFYSGYHVDAVNRRF